MPREASSKEDYRRYRDYYLKREESPAGLKKREERAKARAAEVKSGALKGPHDKREVDHRKPLDKGGSNARGNLRVISRTANRRKFDHG